MLRSRSSGRRILAAPARYLTLGLALVTAVLITGCSSAGSPSSSPPSSSATSSTPAPPSSAPPSSSSGGAGNAAAQQQIKTNWEAFFNGQTSAATKVSVLQNGQEFAQTINQQAQSSLSRSSAAKVKSVVIESPATAKVGYDITLGGQPALSGQIGQAVLENGTWKVGDASFCGLLNLEGVHPPACSSAG